MSKVYVVKCDEEFELWNKECMNVISVCDDAQIAKQYIKEAAEKLISYLLEDEFSSLIRKDILSDGWVYKVLINNDGSADKYRFYCEEMELNKLMDI